MTLYVAIIGLGTLAGILFNVLINKRLIFKILGIVITLITGTFACCVVLFPYFFFESYNSLIIKLTLTSALLIVIYVSARMIVNALSSIKNRDNAADHKETRKAEPAEEVVVADHALKNKVKSIISADKAPVKSLTQRVSVNLDNPSKYASAKETKEVITAQSVPDLKTGVYGNMSSDKGSFGQALKDADAKILSESKALSSDALKPEKQEAAAVVPGSKQEADVRKEEEPVAVKQSLFEYEAVAAVDEPVKEAQKPEAKDAAGSVLGIQYEEAADENAKSVSDETPDIAAGQEVQSELPAEAVVSQEAAPVSGEPAVQEAKPETQSEQPAEEPAIINTEQEDAADIAAETAVQEEAPQVQAEAAEPAVIASEVKADVAERTEQADVEKQQDSGSSKFATIIAKASELMDEGKYVYAAELLQICADHSEYAEQQKQADILIIECLASSGQKTEAQRKWLEFLNKKYILSDADKAKLKTIMTSL